MSDFAQQLTTLLPTLIRSNGTGGLTTAADVRAYESQVIKAVGALELRARGSRIFTDDLYGGPPDPAMGLEGDLFVERTILDLYTYLAGQWVFLVNLMPRTGSGGSVQKLYDTTGQNTDGAMSQKATTDALMLPQVLVRLNVVLDPTTPVVYSGASLADALDALASRGAAGRFAFVDLFRQPAILERNVSITEGVTINGNFKNLRLGNKTISHARSARFNDFNCELGVIASVEANANPSEFVGGKRQAVLHKAVPGSVVKMINIRYEDAPTFVRYSGGGTFILVGITPDPGPGQVANDGTVVQREVASGTDTFAVLPYAASIALDFNAATVRTLALAGNVTFTASANVALLKTKELYLTNTTGADVTLTFPPGWSFFPGPAPTKLLAGKEAALTLRCLGATDSTVKAAYVAQA